MGAWLRAQNLNRSCRQCAKQPGLKRDWDCEPQLDWRGLPVVVYTIYEGSPLRLDLDRCYMHFFPREVGQAMALHDLYARGVMPRFGGALDQPAGLLEAFRWLDYCLAEARECR